MIKLAYLQLIYLMKMVLKHYNVQLVNSWGKTFLVDQLVTKNASCHVWHKIPSTSLTSVVKRPLLYSWNKSICLCWAHFNPIKKNPCIG